MPVIFFVIGVSSLVAYGIYAAQQNAAQISADVTPPVPDAPVIVADSGDYMIVATDRNTWPKGDAIWRFCQAIAYAEGYGATEDNVPTTHHNPGDLGPGDTGYPGDYHSGSTVSLMPDDATGWAALYKKVGKIFSGGSHVYVPSMTILDMAKSYAGDWQNWAKNVANDLGVSQQMTLRDWYGMQ